MPEARVFVVRAAIAIVGLCLAGAAGAEPLFDPDSGPLTGLFGWPTASDTGGLAGDGRTLWRLHATLASHSIVETTGDRSLVLDGETTRAWLEWRRGISGTLEIGVTVPWVWHQSGSLDSVISRWHDLFGLPHGNRESRPEDELLFLYEHAGIELTRLDRNSNGPGDLRIHAGLALRDAPRSRLALRATLKLPTGDVDELFGSGGTDFGIGLSGDLDAPWGIDALSAFYYLSALRLGTPDVLTDHARDLAGQLSVGFEYRFTRGFAVGAQSTVRSAPFDVALDPLGEWAMSLSAGARFPLPGDWQLSLGFSEDVKVESAPDITFMATLASVARR